GPQTARATDPGNVSLKVPGPYRSAIADFMARVDLLPVETDAEARVVINERTGTVVVGGAVRIGPAAVAHGNLSVRISTRFEVSQPPPLSRTGETKVVPNEQVDVQEGSAQLVSLEPGTTLDAVVRALNTLGATPRDIIAIMQALSAAGALKAKIVVM
ncbi:MAG: flagellar basal body P-ring protein FlgI, partial [Vicinamibacterales bacterium]